MRRFVAVVFTMLLAASLSAAPAIYSISPDKMQVNFGEMYIGISGAGFNNGVTAGPIDQTTVTFDGPPGTIVMTPNYLSYSSMQVWVPLEVLSTVGVYAVTVDTHANGVWTHSNAAKLTIGDAPAPVLFLPIEPKAEATSPSGATVTWIVYASSGIDGQNVPVTCDHTSGQLYPVDITRVTCTATDPRNLMSRTGSFPVYVSDTTGPKMTIPSEILAVAPTTAGTTVTWEASAYDIVDGWVPVQCMPMSGSVFPLNTTIVRCSAVDAHHNSAYGEIKVTVGLGTPPLPIPADITAEATGPNGAKVTYTSSITCTPPSGSTFPLGVTDVLCTMGDMNGSFKVAVVDTTPPRLSLPPNLWTSNPNVMFFATAYDLVDGNNVPVDCTPPPGTVFPPGTTTVRCTATDSHGNAASGSFTVTITAGLPSDMVVEATSSNGAIVTYTTTQTCSPASGSIFPLGMTRVQCTNGGFNVTVVDSTPPALTLPPDITTSNPTVTFTATASDVVDGNVPVVCTPPSGSLFPAGTTTVECTATDAHSNSAGGSFRVTVTLAYPDLTVEATSSGGAIVSYSVPDTCTPEPGSLFPLGATLVQCTNGSFHVTVVDTTPPSITSVTASPDRLSPPDHKLVPVVVTVRVSDVDDMLTTHIFDVTANEPLTASDWRLTSNLTLDLRAERSGNADDRVYTIWIECFDRAGNRSVATTTVTVPHDASTAPVTNSPSPPRRRVVGRG